MSKHDYASHVLGTGGKIRQFSVLLLIVALTLILVRLPFMFSGDKHLISDTNRSQLINVVESSMALEANGFSDVEVPNRTFLALPAYVGASVLRLVRLISFSESSAESFEQVLLSKQGLIRYGISALQILLWLIMSLVLYRFVERKLDDTVACFVFWMVALAPAGLVVTGTHLSVFLAIPVIIVLILSVEIYDRAGIGHYIGAGLLAGVAVSFGFHNVLLIVPLLFAHFLSARVPREGSFRLLCDGRFLFLMISFILSSAIFSTSIGEGLRFLVLQTGSNPFSQMHPLSLLCYSSVGEQFSLLYSSSEPLSIIINLSQVLGPLATFLSLGGCIYTLFCEKLRRWRPIAVYILIAVAFRIIPGYPGFDMASEFVAPMVIILAVNLLQQVSRVGYRFQRTLFICAAVVFSFSPIWMIVNKGTVAKGVTFERKVSQLLREDPLIVNSTQIGTFFLSGSKSIRLPLPYSKGVSAQDIYSNWAKTLEPVGNLEKNGTTYGIVNMAFLNQLQKKLESRELSARVGRIADQLNSLEKISADGDNDRAVMIVRFKVSQ